MIAVIRMTLDHVVQLHVSHYILTVIGTLRQILKKHDPLKNQKVKYI